MSTSEPRAKYCPFYKDWVEAIKQLPPEEQAGAYEAIILYGIDGDVSDDATPAQKMAVGFAKPSIDKTLELYETRRKNGSQGGRPPKNGSNDGSNDGSNKPQKTIDNQDEPSETKENQEQTKNKEQRTSKDIEDTNVSSCSKPEAPKPKNNPADFERFWSAYPKKQKKQDALKAWRSAEKQKLLPPVEQIITAIDTAKQCDQWHKDGGQFIPLPATWLRAGSWEDVYDITDKPALTTARLIRESHGHPIGTVLNVQMLDSGMCRVEWPDGDPSTCIFERTFKAVS